MKFPQAYLFFKFGSSVTEQDIRDRLDESVDIAFFPKRPSDKSALVERINFSGGILSYFSHSFGPHVMTHRFLLRSSC